MARLFVISNINLITDALPVTEPFLLSSGVVALGARCVRQTREIQNVQPVAFLCRKEIWLIALNVSANCGV